MTLPPSLLQVYETRRVGPEGDLYMHGVRKVRLMNENGGYPRVLAVHTGDVQWCRELLLFPVMYQLPAHLPQLLQKIHQLTPAEAKNLDIVSRQT